MKCFIEIAFVLTVFLSFPIEGTGQSLLEHPWGWEKPPVVQNLAWQRKEVEGFAYPNSVKSGDSVHLYISVLDLLPSSSGGDHYDMRVYRIGGTDTLVLQVNNQLGYFFPMHDSVGQEIGWGDTTKRPVEYKRGCLQYWQNGHVGFSTSGWKSGVYYAKLIHLTDNTKINYVPFVVKSASPGTATNILLKYELTTFQAYNYWGGGSLYSYSQDTTHQILAWTDSIALDRPLTFTQAQAHTYFLQSFLRVLSDSGYTVEFCNNVDLDKTGNGFGQELLSHYNLLILWNHDEYWSTIERDNIELFFKENPHHGNIARFAPNTCYWRIGWEGGFLGSHLRLGCLKGNYPPYDSTYDKWRWNGIGGANRPEAKFLGSQYETGYNLESRPDSVVKPLHWIFRKTDLAATDTFGIGFLENGIRKGIVSGEIDNTVTGRAAFPLDTLAERWVLSVTPTGTGYLKHQMIYHEDTGTNSRNFASGAGGWWLGFAPEATDITDIKRMRTITINIISHFSGKKYIGKVYTTVDNKLIWDSNIELDGAVQIPTGKYLKAQSCTITADSTFAVNGTLEINGNVSITGPGQVTVGATGEIKLMPGAMLTLRTKIFTAANAILIVPTNTTLKIEPPAELFFDNASKLLAYGELKIIGTAKQPVLMHGNT